MTRIHAFSHYVETAFAVAIGLAALAGIVRVLVMTV